MNHETSNKWHRAQNERISVLAEKMAELYVFDYKMPQTPEYEALRAEYLQAMSDSVEHDKFIDPEYKNYERMG